MAKQYPQPWKWKRSPNYYFSYRNGSGRRHIKSTKTTTKQEARAYIEQHMSRSSQRPVVFAQYAQPFYLYNECPHIRRLRDENRSVGREHAKLCRRVLEKYVFTDAIAQLPLHEIKRGDLLDFRSRMRRDYGDGTANRAMKVLKTIFKEAMYRQDISYDTTAGIGIIKTESRESGTFSDEELQRMFGPETTPWTEPHQYIIFLLASEAGMRRGEILEIRWGDVDWENGVLGVCRARKGADDIGLPKWGKTRTVPINALLFQSLRQIFQDCLMSGDSYRIAAWLDGIRIHERSVQRWFEQGMERLGIDRIRRNLTIHSFRHTYITRLKQAGVDPAAVRAIVGHSEEKTTEAYTHYDLGWLKEQAGKLR